MEIIDTASWMVPWESFLKSGALFAEPQTTKNDEKKIWVAWDLISIGQKPHEDLYSIWAPDFFLENQRSWYHWGQCRELDQTEFLSQCIKSASGFSNAVGKDRPGPLIQWSELSQANFLEDFNASMERLNGGIITKIVPLVMGHGRIEGTTVRDMGHRLPLLLQKILAPSVSGEIYGLWHQGEGVLGVTPELLCEVHAKRFLKTMALAGTHPTTNAEALLSNPKIRKEHSIVVDSLINNLRDLGKITQSATYVVKHLSLSHLQTDIFLESTSSLSIENVIDRLHPTPALGGYPKQPSLEILRKLSVDSETRRRFGAPFALMKPNGDFSVLVAIRNLQWHNLEVFLGSGCGLIQESEASDEWQEVLLKQKAVRELMGI